MVSDIQYSSILFQRVPELSIVFFFLWFLFKFNFKKVLKSFFFGFLAA